MSARTASAAALLGAAACYLTSQLVWPQGSDADTATTLRAAAAHPAAWTAATAAETLSALLGVPGAIGVATWLRGRGRVLGLLGAIGAVLSCVAFSSGGVMNIVTLSLAQHLPADQAASTYAALTSQPYLFGVVPLFYLGGIGAILLAVGAVRGGLVRWWVIALAALGLIAQFFNDGLDAPVTALLYLPTGAASVMVGIALLRAPAEQPVTVSAPPATSQAEALPA